MEYIMCTTRILGANMELIIEPNEILLDIDLVMATFTRDELLSALGFDQPSDFLEEVTVSDAIGYFGENVIIREIDITDYWDAEDAVNRYDTELLSYFGSYSNTEDWSASDYLDNYGDTEYMLEVILLYYLGLKDVHKVLYDVLSKEAIEELLGYFGKTNNVKHNMLEALLKAQYGALKDSQC